MKNDLDDEDRFNLECLVATIVAVSRETGACDDWEAGKVTVGQDPAGVWEASCRVDGDVALGVGPTLMAALVRLADVARGHLAKRSEHLATMAGKL